MHYVQLISYIAYSVLLFYLWQTWQLILASAAIVLLLFAIAGIGLLIHMR